MVDDGKTLMVNDVLDATTTIYAIDPETKQLTTKQTVESHHLILLSPSQGKLFSVRVAVNRNMSVNRNWAQEQTIFLSFQTLEILS